MVDFIKRHKRSAAWLIGFWMLLVLFLLANGPVVHVR